MQELTPMHASHSFLLTNMVLLAYTQIIMFSEKWHITLYYTTVYFPTRNPIITMNKFLTMRAGNNEMA